jgi:hypothetical protein
MLRCASYEEMFCNERKVVRIDHRVELEGGADFKCFGIVYFDGVVIG